MLVQVYWTTSFLLNLYSHGEEMVWNCLYCLLKQNGGLLLFHHACNKVGEE